MPQTARDARYVAGLERIARERIGMPPQRAQAWAIGKFRAKFGREPGERAA
jgi:hypothetical protein